MPEPLDQTRFSPPEMSPAEEQRAASIEACEGLLWSLCVTADDSCHACEGADPSRLEWQLDLGPVEDTGSEHTYTWGGMTPVQQLASTLADYFAALLLECLTAKPLYVHGMEAIIAEYLAVWDPQERECRVKMVRRVLEDCKHE